MKLIVLHGSGAPEMGVNLPASVARQDSKRNAKAVVNTFARFPIILTNAVKYMTNVESHGRRFQ